MNDNYHQYFNYLRNRSFLGFLYRKYWLYPRICAHLDGRVLDVGCGIGDFVKFRKQTTGVDINPETVEFCKKQGLDVFQMEINKLPFLSSEFDGILLDNVLEHIESPRLLIEEIYRVLKPSGTFLVGVPGRKGYTKDLDHKVFYDAKKLVETISALGFVNETNFYMPLKSTILDLHLSQFCLYAKFTRV
jgi:SAM-dependent methyltransferase